MSELVAFYEDEPTQLKGRIEIRQEPVGAAAGLRSSDGAVRTEVVYVRRPSEAGPFLVPFGEFDDWSLRDRYNEAIRIMNTLGAASITCETFREITKKKGLKGKVLRVGKAKVTSERVQNSGFDFRHEGAGSAPRSPFPLRWPDEPGFAAAVSSVLDNAATEVVINIRSNRSHAVDGSLGVELKKLGFELGAGSAASDATSLHIRAQFPPRKKGWL